MKFNYKFSNLCGVSYKCGNLLFTPDGGSLLSPVGNRVTVFDLENHTSSTLPFEARKNIHRIALSHDGHLLIVVDVDGRGLLVNFARGVIMHRFNFKKRVKALSFSPDDRFIAVSHGRQVQVWVAPNRQKEFSPLSLHRTYTGHHDDVVSISWSPDSRYFVTASKDMTARVYSTNPERGFQVVTLSGHRSRIVAAFFRVERKEEFELGRTDETQSPYSIYTLSRDGSLIIWNWKWLEGKVPTVSRRTRSSTYAFEDSPSDVESLASDGDDDESNADELDALLDGRDPPLSIDRGQWVQESRKFIQKDASKVTCAVLQEQGKLLLVGFNNGVFGLFDMPTVTPLQNLSVSQHVLNTCTMNGSGDWVALASAELGQLLVWEWQSETYVLKQQGHFYDMNTVAYSPDGQLLATGGDDHKLKLWSTSSGFCFTTFTEHQGPITAITFLGGENDGNAVLSASLDGTVRAFDLVRYRNFRTLTTPTPTQFTSLAVDGQGEVVCAGALDPPEIYMWSLQTGRLLDVLAGHQGPVSGLAFSPSRAVLVSSSWDKTVRVWEPYKSTSPAETFNHNSDVLSVSFRPDGRQICSASLDGQLNFWDMESGKSQGSIEGRRDISGGRRQRDKVAAANAAHSKYFTSVCYTADGQCVLAGGRSKFICIYAVAPKLLLKKFQLSHNRSLDGVLDKLNSAQMTEGGSAALMDVSGDSDSDDANFGAKGADLPGSTRGDAGKRSTGPEIRSKAVQFAPNGQSWAAASTEGLLVYSLDTSLLFDPIDLDETVTPARTRQMIREELQYTRGLLMALHLGESSLIREVYQAVPRANIPLVARSIPVAYLGKLFDELAGEIEASPHLEYQLAWAAALLTGHNDVLRDMSVKFMKSFRAIQKAVTAHKKELGELCESNTFTLSYLSGVAARSQQLVDLK